MARWLLLSLFGLWAMLPFAMGCRNPCNLYAPYGSQCVPPPATGTIGQPYYQPAPQGYPANPYFTGFNQPGFSPTAATMPAWPAYGTTVVQDGSWFGSPSAAPTSSGIGTLADVSNTEMSDTQTPRPSGQFLSTQDAQQLRQNSELAWLNSSAAATSQVIATGANSVPVGSYADSIPAYHDHAAEMTYSAPIRPSVVRTNPPMIMDQPINYAPVYQYGVDYVLDPYADIIHQPSGWTYQDAYGSSAVAPLEQASTSGWSAKR